ncbi:MAG: hypothetical protein QOC69_188 [Mycobacterium sp.]|nr:hypothetical protein [Mycobacterium sp.]
MTTSVLAYIPSPAQGVWHLGPVPLRAYALCIILGIVAALIIGDRRWVARGGQPGVIYDIALWAVPFGLVGGRLYHVITDWKTYFGDDGAGFGAALRIWDGGLGIWGAVALGGVGAWIGCRSRGIPLPAFGDAIAPGIVLAQAIGRLGNYFNQELYGRPTTLPWGLEIYERRNSAGALDSLNGVSTGRLVDVVHPTFLYELLWNVLVFAVLIWVDRRFKIGHGRLFALYVAGYCVGRFWVELMRSDLATHIAGIRINTFTSTFVFIAAVVYIMVAPKGREDPATLKGNDVEDEDEESALDEIGEELVAVAATSGLVAAAKVAGAEDAREESGGAGEAKPADDAATPAAEEPVVADAPPDDVEESESESDDEAVDIEGAEPISTESGPMSEQAEELAAEPEDEPEEVDEPEADGRVDAEAEAVEAAEDAIESEASEPDEDEDEDEDEEAENEPEAVEAEPAEAETESEEAEAVADEVAAENEPAESDVVAESAEAEPESDAAEAEEGLGSVEGDEVVTAREDAPEVHEAAVEGAEEAEAVAEELAAESDPAESAEPEPAESAEAEPAEPESDAAEPEEGLGSVEGDEVVEAQEDAPEVHEAAVEGAEEAEAVADEVAAESDPAVSAVAAEPVTEPPRGRWWRRRG